MIRKWGPVGSKVVLSGQSFGAKAPADGRVSFGGKPAVIAQWTDRHDCGSCSVKCRDGTVGFTSRGTGSDHWEF